MTKKDYWDMDTQEKRIEYQEKVQRKINKLLVDYEFEYEETPFYLNTGNCILEGAIDELKSLNAKNIDYGGIGCYLGGRIEALEKLKHECIYGEDGDKDE